MSIATIIYVTLCLVMCSRGQPVCVAPNDTLRLWAQCVASCSYHEGASYEVLSDVLLGVALLIAGVLGIVSRGRWLPVVISAMIGCFIGSVNDHLIWEGGAFGMIGTPICTMLVTIVARLAKKRWVQPDAGKGSGTNGTA
jgi:Co/Zn/Cd efflux system component